MIEYKLDEEKITDEKNITFIMQLLPIYWIRQKTYWQYPTKDI